MGRRGDHMGRRGDHMRRTGDHVGDHIGRRVIT